MKTRSLMTQKVTLKHTQLNTPQSFKQGDKEKYSVRCVFSGDINNQVKEINECLTKVFDNNAITMFKDVDFNKVNLPLKQEADGTYYLNATTMYRPIIVDRKKSKLDKSIIIKDGSEARLIMKFSPYIFSKSKTIKYGIAAYIEKIQIINLVEQDLDFDEWVEEEDII